MLLWSCNTVVYYVFCAAVPKEGIGSVFISGNNHTKLSKKHLTQAYSHIPAIMGLKKLIAFHFQRKQWQEQDIPNIAIFTVLHP